MHSCIVSGMIRTSTWRVSGVLVVAVLGCIGTAAAQSRLEFRDGLVFLSARDVPLNELLHAWEQRGGTKVVFQGPVPSQPVSLELNGASESSALDALLSSTGGYLALARDVRAAGQSRFAVLLVVTERDQQGGLRAVQQALEAAQQQPCEAAGRELRLVDFRDLPARDPNDPNTPPALTPASVGDAAPPPLAFPADDVAALKASGRDPGVNPIPLGIPPPAPSALKPPVADATAVTGPQTGGPPPATAKPVKPPRPPGGC